MKKKIALLLCAAMVLALAACSNDETPETPASITATPTPGQKKTVTATPTPSPKKEWKLEPTWTPTPTPTLTPEQQAAKEAEEAAKLAASQFNKTINLKLADAISVSGDLPTIINDTEASMTGGKTQKFCVPLGVIVKAGKTAAVTVTLQFNTADDEAIRLYGIQGTGDSAKTDVVKIMNPGNTDTFTTTVYMTAKEDFDTMLVASSGWGKYVNDAVVKKITVAPNPKIDLATVAKISGDLPTVSDDGTLICKGGVTQKIAFDLGNTFHKDDVLAVTVTSKFNSAAADDESFRFYAIQDGADSAKSDVVKVFNPGNKSTFTETILLTLNADANQLLLASSGWGKFINDIEIKSLSVKQAEVLDLSKVFAVSGNDVTILDDGSISAKGGVTSKFAIPSERTDMSKGSNVTAAITFQFNTADDESVRLYPIMDANDSSCVATPLQYANPGTTDATVITQSFTTTKDANTILLGGKGWGVNLNDVVIKKVVLYETPVVEKVAETGKQDTTPKTGDNSMMIMIVLLGMAAVSGVVFFKKREEVR